MPTRLSAKFAALGVALTLNGIIIGGVVYLFSSNARDAALLPAANHAACLVALMPTI